MAHTKGVADGNLDIGPVSRARQIIRGLACRGNVEAIVLDELITEFTSLAGGPAALETTRSYHEPTITPESNANAPGQQPSLGLIATTLVAEYTVNTDTAYRIFKIPGNYIEGASFHVHWTKESGAGGDGNQDGNAVRWRISYTVSPGNGADINAAPTVLEVEDTYDDSGTTTRIMHRTANMAASGFIPNYYVAMCVEAITPVGGALTCEPALVTADLTFNEYINQ